MSAAALKPATLAEQLRAMRRRAILVYRATPSGPVYGIHGTVPDLATLTNAAAQLEWQGTELRAAHAIIGNALAVMTTEQKVRWGELNERDGVAGEGITRANERLALIEREGGAA